MKHRIERRKGINHPREEMEDSAEGWLRQSKEKGTKDFNSEDTESRRPQTRERVCNLKRAATAI
jgi:hypothetical protein